MPQLVLLKVTEKGGVLALARLQDLLVIERIRSLNQRRKSKSKPIDSESFVLRLNNNVFE